MKGTVNQIALHLFLLLLFMSIATSLHAAGDAIHISIQNDSLFESVLQVRDDAYRSPKEIECSNARIQLQSQECLNNPSASACRIARESYDSACGCGRAGMTLASEVCRDRQSSQECTDARAKIDSASCQKGLIYDGSVPIGAKITLTISSTPGGYGAVSIRDIRKGPTWKSYRIISDGEMIRYP